MPTTASGKTFCSEDHLRKFNEEQEQERFKLPIVRIDPGAAGPPPSDEENGEDAAARERKEEEGNANGAGEVPKPAIEVETGKDAAAENVNVGETTKGPEEAAQAPAAAPVATPTLSVGDRVTINFEPPANA
eukprot:184005-Pleurochrysis_carterae.AAC.1